MRTIWKKMKDTKQQFEHVIAICRDLYSKKLHDYGPAWRILRPASVTDQIFIKANRIRSIETKGVTLVDEGIRSEFIAIVNYGIIGLIQLELGYAESADISIEEALALYDKYVKEALELMLAKNHDYDEAWRSMRISSYTDLILMKIYRTKQIESLSGNTLVSEGIDAKNLKVKNLHIIQEVIANISRFILAAAFIFSGFVKAVDPLGFQYKIQDYLAAFGMASWFPSFFPLLGGIALSAIEFSIGIFLFFGVRRTVASTLALMLMSFMTPLTLYLAIFNPVSDCGCFGDAWVLTNWETFIKNVLLLLAAIGAFKGRKMLVRFISQKMEWLVSLYTLFFVFTLSFYCLDRLPVLDFRPYKVGKNILEGMTMPEGAKPSVYESVFILEKNGEKKEFTLENYPDSTWTFVDTHTVLKEKGYEPAIHDFSMIELNTGEDITEDVLTDMGYTFLLVAHRIEEADDSNIDLINEVYDYSVEHGYKFYCLTSSPEEQIELWKDKTGAEYPFCQMDDITLKTMIRSNPGLMLIKNGTILNKWSDEDIPDEYVLTDKLENLPLGQQKVGNDVHTVGFVFLWFVIPLLLVLGVDVLVVRRRERRNTRKAAEAKKQKSEVQNIVPKVGEEQKEEEPVTDGSDD